MLSKLYHPVLGSLLIIAAGAQAQEPARSNQGVPRMRAYALEKAPRIDGLIDHEWMSLEPATGFIQQLPDEGQLASERTEVRIGYTSKALYIGIICFDSNPGGIVSNQSRRDGLLLESDSIEILLDTYNDDQNGYIFATTPAGNEYDGQVIHGGQARQRGGASVFNLNWDSVWKVRTQITERGWEAEFEIPFRSLRYATGGDQV